MSFDRVVKHTRGMENGDKRQKKNQRPSLTFYLFPFFLDFICWPGLDRNSFAGWKGPTDPVAAHTTTTHHPGDSDGHHRLPIISSPVGSKRISTHKWMAAVQLYHYAQQFDNSWPAISQVFEAFETFGWRVPAVFFFFFLYKRPMRPSSTLCV